MRCARDAIEEALAARIGDGMDIPAPASRSHGRAVALPLMAALKVSLYRSLREAGLTRAELMRRLGWNGESVDRLFRLEHALATGSAQARKRAFSRKDSRAPRAPRLPAARADLPAGPGDCLRS